MNVHHDYKASENYIVHVAIRSMFILSLFSSNLGKMQSKEDVKTISGSCHLLYEDNKKQVEC
jgi:hypothetical protein